MIRRRAAYFELRADYFGRAFDDGIIRALLSAGFDVDLFAPEGDLEQDLYGEHVRRFDVDYRRGWLQSNLGRKRWRDYDVFLGTADLPMAFAGSLAAVARRQVVTACDEIYVGGYEGSAALYWKPIVRWAMRRAVFTIITDEIRIPLQRSYAQLDESHEFIQYPCCFSGVYAGRSRAEARAELGIGDDEFVLAVTGSFSAANGADWVVDQLDRRTMSALIQPGGGQGPVIDALLARLEGAIYLPERLNYFEAAEITVAADAAAVFYLSDKPQFQRMGVSSQKLCTALWLGVPVIATRQESFQFVEERKCGVLIDHQLDLDSAIEKIRTHRAEYATNAREVVNEHINPDARLNELAERFRRI
jgi:hypothetical protein